MDGLDLWFACLHYLSTLPFFPTLAPVMACPVVAHGLVALSMPRPQVGSYAGLYRLKLLVIKIGLTAKWHIPE